MGGQSAYCLVLETVLSCVHSGGKSLALTAELEQLGGRACIAMLQESLNTLQAGQPQEVQPMLDVVKELAWEKLHTGNWKDVPMAWRDLYSLSCLLLASISLATRAPPSTACSQSTPRLAAPGDTQTWQHMDERQRLTAALRELDMAAMMGGTRFRSLVDDVIASAQLQLQVVSKLPESEEGSAAGAAESAAQPVSAVTRDNDATTNVEDCEASCVAAHESSEPLDRHSIHEGPPLTNLAADIATNSDPGQPPAKRRRLIQQANVSNNSPVVPLPAGSLEPDGTRPPVEDLPSLERFFVEYMTPGTPVIVTGALTGWPALTRWQDLGYLCQVAGPRTVPVEVGRHYLADGWGQQLMPLQDFISQHVCAPGRTGGQQSVSGTVMRQCSSMGAPSNGDRATYQAHRFSADHSSTTQHRHDSEPHPEPPGLDAGAAAAAAQPAVGYLAQHPLFEQIPALARDIAQPEYCCLGEGEVQSVNAWFGPAGTVTPLHHDPHHNLLAQVVGSKYVRLYPPPASARLYPYPHGLTTNSSQVDLDAPDMERFPLFTGLSHIDCVLQPGQMLYIPPGWWHYVKACSVSFSVSFWWQ